MSAVARVVVSAPSSGHGKTAVAVGLLAAVAARGVPSAGFKIGPDYIDAAYLGLAAGRHGRNLDPRLVGPGRLGPLFLNGVSGAQFAVVEGTMGLFDGLAGQSDTESTAQVAGLLRAPVILVVDAAAMGQSVAALVHGFRTYDELLWLGGVVLNRVASARHEQVLREALADLGVPVLGALSRKALGGLGPQGLSLPPRHHGVVPVVHGNIEAVRAVRRLGEIMSRAIDLDQVMALASSAPRLTCEPWSAEQEVLRIRRDPRSAEPAGAAGASGSGAMPDAAGNGQPTPDDGQPAQGNGQPGPGNGYRPLIALAGSASLSYGYAETAELLLAAGARVVMVDPLRDTRLPDGVDGVVIGGALPESYAEELSANTGMCEAIAAVARSGRPVVAEGAALVWLCRQFAGRRMVGVIDATARPSDMVVIGYREAEAVSDSVLLAAGTRVVGHKLHRTLVMPRAGQRGAWVWQGSPPEGYVDGGVHASYLCLHWAGTPEMAVRLVAAARRQGAAGGPTEAEARAASEAAQAADPVLAGSTVVEPEPVDSRLVEPMHGDPRLVEPVHGDSRLVESEHDDPMVIDGAIVDFDVVDVVAVDEPDRRP